MTSNSHPALVSVTRRTATDDDYELLYEIYASTREPEMGLVDWSDAAKLAFLRQQHHAQHTFYHAEYADADYEVLMMDGVPIGRIYRHRRTNELNLIDIALLPEFRNHGIGTALIKETMQEAAPMGVPVTLHVETFNPALRLYDRLGFTRVRDEGVYIYMEWSPSNECA